MTPKKMLWAGYLVSALPVLMLLFSAILKLVKPASVAEGFARIWDMTTVSLWAWAWSNCCPPSCISFHARRYSGPFY